MEIHPSKVSYDNMQDPKLETLEEDEDQGEMDTVFWIMLTFFTVSQLCIEWWYPDTKDREAIGKFEVIMTNLWAFFPIMQAQGLFLKSLLIGTLWYSILWHWTRVGFAMPGDHDLYGKLDTVFSTLIIVAYAMSWLPKFKTKIPTKLEERKSCWYKNCRGPPKETGEWRCRWTPNLLLNMAACGLLSSYMIIAWPDSGTAVVCWLSICLAMLTALYHLCRGKMKVGKKFRRNFLFWAATGISMGIISFTYKLKSDDEGNAKKNLLHSVWHVFVFSCAYCLSRASEYLEIYRAM
jgi:hypothetical protein